MSVPHLIAFASGPALALGFGMALIEQYRGVRWLSSPLHLVICALVALPIILIFNYRHATELNALVATAMTVLGGCAVCWGGVYLWRHAGALLRATPSVLHPRIAGCVAVILGIGMSLYGAVTFNGDFVQPRETIEGVVTGRLAHKDMRFGNSFTLDIDGRRFPTTAEVYAAARSFSHVRASVGRGSGTVFTTAD